MEDEQIMAERNVLVELIHKKDREWDEYRKKYAGAPEFWEVQRNAYNEIAALRSRLAKLPSTSKEKTRRLIRGASATGALAAGIALIWFMKGLAANIAFIPAAPLFTWTSWSILSFTVCIPPAAYVIKKKSDKDGYFNLENNWKTVTYATFAFSFLLLIRLLISPDFSNMDFEGWKGWGAKSLLLSLLPTLSYLGYKFFSRNLDSDEYYTAVGLLFFAWAGLIVTKGIWWLVGLLF